MAGSEAISRLLEALEVLGLGGQVDPSGRWVRVPRESCHVFVFAAAWDAGYYTWCDDPETARSLLDAADRSPDAHENTLAVMGTSGRLPRRRGRRGKLGYASSAYRC